MSSTYPEIFTPVVRPTPHTRCGVCRVLTRHHRWGRRSSPVLRATFTTTLWTAQAIVRPTRTKATAATSEQEYLVVCVLLALATLGRGRSGAPRRPTTVDTHLGTRTSHPGLQRQAEGRAS